MNLVNMKVLLVYGAQAILIYPVVNMGTKLE